MTQEHELRETLSVDVVTPAHADRVTTPLFRHTKKALFEKAEPAIVILRDEPGRCWICGQTEAELGQPLEAHHFGVERSTRRFTSADNSGADGIRLLRPPRHDGAVKKEARRCHAPPRSSHLTSGATRSPACSPPGCCGSIGASRRWPGPRLNPSEIHLMHAALAWHMTARPPGW